MDCSLCGWDMELVEEGHYVGGEETDLGIWVPPLYVCTTCGRSENGA